MREKTTITIRTRHANSGNYLIFGLLLIIGIIAKQTELTILIAVGLVLYSLLDVIAIQGPPRITTHTATDKKDEFDDDTDESWQRLGDRSLITGRGSYDWHVKRKKRDETIH